MTLTDIRLQQYRSYTDASFDLGEGVNIVVGPNAAGKTNLLEAIMVSCTGTSFRAKDTALIHHEADWARIDVHTNDNGLRTVKIQHDSAGRLQKTFEINDKPYRRLPHSSRIPIVLFEPNDLRLIEGEPTERRTYLDTLISQYTDGYDKTLAHYKRVLAQRNSLLKQGSRSMSQLFAWNLRLADLGSRMAAERVRLVEEINKSINGIYTSIAEQDKAVSVEYESQIDTSNYSTNLLNKLEASIELDSVRGFTGSGPHRDDFSIQFNQRPATLSASRGELRTTLLSLKKIELDILEDRLHTRPLLLLDDVFSELDDARRRALTEFLKDHQTIITTTDADAVINNFTDKYTTIPLSKSES